MHNVVLLNRNQKLDFSIIATFVISKEKLAILTGTLTLNSFSQVQACTRLHDCAQVMYNITSTYTELCAACYSTMTKPSNISPVMRVGVPYLAPRAKLHVLHYVRKFGRRYATAAPHPPEIYDVVCVGGGPAGLTLLTALRILCS